MKRVVIESPLAGNSRDRICLTCGRDAHVTWFGCQNPQIINPFKRNIRYAQLCVLDSLRRGEAPFASHLLYTQVLDDKVPVQRRLGMSAGLKWAEFADVCALYVDLGVSDGMLKGKSVAEQIGVVVEERRLDPDLMVRVNEDPSLWETLK